MSKELLSSEQTEVLAPKDSDCGTKKGVPIKLSKEYVKDFHYRYFKEGGDWKVLTPEIANKYIDRTLLFRTPMCCIGVGKNKNLCNKCAGDFYYKLDKPNIGLLTCSIGGKISNLNLQKFHDNTVKTRKIELDDILI